MLDAVGDSQDPASVERGWGVTRLQMAMVLLPVEESGQGWTKNGLPSNVPTLQPLWSCPPFTNREALG